MFKTLNNITFEKIKNKKLKLRVAIFFLTVLLLFSCKRKSSKKLIEVADSNQLELRYAKGFSINDYGTYKIIQISDPWPDAEKTYKYFNNQKKCG